MIIDVTTRCKDWLTTPSADFGFALLSTDGTAIVTIGAKEGPGTGYPPSLEIDTGSGGAVGVGAIGSAQIANGAVGTQQLAPGAVLNADLANPSLTVATGAGLSGGGSVALGGSLTLTNSGVLSLAASPARESP